LANIEDVFPPDFGVGVSILFVPHILPNRLYDEDNESITLVIRYIITMLKVHRN